jgi:hydrogenase maturation protease
MTDKRILIACLGNIFHGDDGFGTEVARALALRDLPANVRLVDFGIRGVDLVYALLDGYEATILVDIVRRDGRPGTLYVIEPDRAEIEKSAAGAAIIEPHALNPLKVLAIAHSMGAKFEKLRLVGCEPETLGGEEGFLGLSETVRSAVEKAADLVESLTGDILESRAAGD